MFYPRPLLALLLVAVLGASVATAPATPRTPSAPVRIIWVGAQDRALARAQIARALAYWRELGGATLPAAPIVEVVVGIADPFASWRWLLALQDPNWLTIAVVANPAGNQVQLGGGVGSYGYNIAGGAAMYCTTHNDLMDYPDGLGMCVAHELGHYLGLPEGGPERDGKPASIMRDLVGAWTRWELHPLDRQYSERTFIPAL